MAFIAQYNKDGTVNAGPFSDETSWDSISEVSRYWEELMELTNNGVDIQPYVPPAPPIPDSVSRRQFKMQLEIAGLTAQVNTWVSAQSTLIQIAFNESGSFLRNDPMLQQGFTGLGFTTEQLDAFFVAASAL